MISGTHLSLHFPLNNLCILWKQYAIKILLDGIVSIKVISQYWSSLFTLLAFSACLLKMPTDSKFISHIVDLFRDIWENRTLCIRDLYRRPPKLHSRYLQIQAILHSECTRRNTTHLKRWLARVDHQISVTNLIKQKRLPGQLTTPQAFHNAASVNSDINKNPP